MADYNLSRLSTRDFEQLVQAIALREISAGVVIYGDGPDGGREATFEGCANYPSKDNPWNGYIVIQAKFKQRPQDIQKDGEWALKQLEKELKDFANPRKRRRNPEYYIFATNIVLTAVQNKGTKDKVNKLFEKFKDSIPLKGYDIWDYDKIRVFLDNLEDIRHSYAALITSGDVLAQLMKKASQPNQVNSEILTYKSKEAGVIVDIEVLTQEIREKIKPDIQKRCGTMRVLDMTQPIELNKIYTSVNILEKITGRKRLEFSQLMENCDPEHFDRFVLSKVTEERVPGLNVVERCSKLMVLGKPGAGKTTFLKYIATQCISGKLKKNYIPIFITLKQFAEIHERLNLQEFICHQLSNIKCTNIEIIQLLQSGKFIILLDGLDEIKEEDMSITIKHIEDFYNLYSTNSFIITCRIAASEYIFEKFTEVEVADFNKKQIEAFVTNWFLKKEPDAAKKFIKQLQLHKSIKELANNPLLLTLLCLEFEDSGDFPSDHAELYNRAIHTLLRKWDSKRGIVRDEVYKKLSIRHKEDLLSEIAWKTFKSKDYFFKQRNVEEYISDYIRNLPEAKTDPEALRVDSEAILKSIEAKYGLLVERARGIYSFSHLTFQEYFTAREIVYNPNQENMLKTLVSHISEKRWKEVFLLTVKLLKNADNLLVLMKSQTDGLLAYDEKLQQFLTWVNEKARSVEVDYKPAAVRAFYFCLDKDISLYKCFDLARHLDQNLDRDFPQDPDPYQHIDIAGYFNFAKYLRLVRSKGFMRYLAESFKSDIRDFQPYLNLGRELSLSQKQKSNPQLKRAFQQIQEQLPNPEGNEEVFKQWWNKNGQSWAKELKDVVTKHCNIGHDWQFSNEQEELLTQYYNANKLLIDCLKSACYVSREVRQEIESTLLLPATHP